MGFAATAHICALNWTRLGSAGGFDHPSQLHDRCLRSVFAPDRGRNRFAFKAPRPEARIEADGGVALHRGVSNADVTSMPLPQDKCGNKRAIARRKGRISCFSRMDMGTIVNKPRPKAADATDRGMPAGPFVSHESTQSYLVQGHLIRLRHHPNVFSPSAFGVQFAERVTLNAGERVVDIGTGTGLLAILAAKNGAGEVVATDTCETALAITRSNARELNGVPHIETRHGSFFCGADGVFDAITANLPQEIVPPAHLAELNETQARAICGGGPGGNSVLLSFLEAAPYFMHAASRLYVIVNTITDYKSTIGAIERSYRARVVWSGVARTKPFVGAHIGWFLEFLNDGVTDIFRDDDGHWLARQHIYELRRSGS
jgi:methylase of polypeptide subunit release factors